MMGLGRGQWRSRLLEFGASRSGAALVEAAIVIPVMLIIMAGVFELGRAFYAYHTLDHAVRVSARYVARARPSNLDAALAHAANLARAQVASAGITEDQLLIAAPLITNESITYAVSTDFPVSFLSIIGQGTTITLRASHEQPNIGE